MLQDLLLRLNAIDPTQEAQISGLAKEVENSARQPVREAVEVWKLGGDRGAKAIELLSRLDELSIVPLLEAPGPLPPEQQVWALRTVTANLILFHNRAAQMVEGLLDDRRPVPMPPSRRPIEEPPPPRRICDEAYLAMRRLLNPAENREQYTLNADAFRHLTEAERDAEIQKARGMGVWTEWIGEA